MEWCLLNNQLLNIQARSRGIGTKSFLVRNLLLFKKTLWLICLAILGNDMKVESVFIKTNPHSMRCGMAAIRAEAGLSREFSAATA